MTAVLFHAALAGVCPYTPIPCIWEALKSNLLNKKFRNRFYFVRKTFASKIKKDSKLLDQLRDFCAIFSENYPPYWHIPMGGPI